MAFKLDVLCVTLILITFGLLISFGDSKKCTQSYSCSYSCSRKSRYYVSCGLFGLFRCTKYRTRYSTCYRTCYRQVCCSGYTGSSCSQAICYGSTSCLNGNTCVSPGVCSCRTGFQLPQCADINECSTNIGGCEHACKNTVGSFSCTCNTGYTLNTDLKTCGDINECILNKGGCAYTCTNTAGSYKCNCDDGYTLATDRHNCADVNECLGTDACDQTCINTDGSYICSCKDGYRLGIDGRTCTDINECIESPEVCEQRCTNKPGSYTCGCGDGYIVDNSTDTCLDIDECENYNGQCSDTCTNTDGSYLCSCPSGYELNADKRNCFDTDECSRGMAKCSQACINTQGSFRCSCDSGYKLEADGFTCTDIDDCDGVTCDNDGTCVDNVGSYTCSCRIGFTGRHCEQDIDECVGFLNGGCEDICQNTVGSYTCGCKGNNTLQDDGFSCSGGNGDQASIFSRYGLVRQLLPRGCSTVLLTKCNEAPVINVFMSSTSSWYQLKSNRSRIYTFGVVFVEVNSVALPVSVTGMEIVITDTNFELITGSMALDMADGNIYGEERTHFCLKFDTTPRDIRDFLESNSFMRSLFYNLEGLLPDWLRFSNSGSKTVGIYDLRTSLLKGKDVQQGDCKGAPLIENRLYSVIQFGNEFSMALYGQELTIPSPLNNKKFCIIVDICQDFGGSVFMILPEESRNILDKFDIFKILIDKHGLYFRPIGLGLSMFKHINVNTHVSEVQVWNGDELFNYPVFPEANLWIGGEAQMNQDIFRASGETNVFISIPKPTNFLKNVFYDEWELVLVLKTAATLEYRLDIPVVGVQTIRGSAKSAVNAIASIGGTKDRSWCGPNANPPGIYVSFFAEADAFLDVPILSFIKPDVYAKVYAFITSDPNVQPNEETEIDVVEDLIKLRMFVESCVNITLESLQKYDTLLSNYSVTAVTSIAMTGRKMIDQLEYLLSNIEDMLMNGGQPFIEAISLIWQDGWIQLQNNTLSFIDSIRENNRVVKYNITNNIEHQVAQIRIQFEKALRKITTQLTNVITNINGFGLYVEGKLNIFSLEIVGLKFEIIYSIDRLGHCSRFTRAFDVFKDQRAIRASFTITSELSYLGRFLKPIPHIFNGLAVSLDQPGNIAVLFHVEAKFLDIPATVDLIINKAGLYLYIEGNVWNIFKVQLEIFAEHGNTWYELNFSIKGRFIADATGDGSFEDSYISALRRFTKHIADEADKRISKVQDTITSVQKGLTAAQNWLEDKKAVVRSANTAFDSAVNFLDKAKDKLEEAKKPFNDALNELNAAQRKVDNLCRIKTCKTLCIPGIKCRICRKKVWGIRIPYPCCRLTKCMISFPDPICVVANFICQAIRALAYLALEAVKIFVRIPMLALDVAKVALSAAQFVVDKSRVVLDIAIAAMDVAKIGLEVAKVALEGAKIALEAVKHVVRWGVAALNFVIQYGLQSIVDVRNCGFEVLISTHDLPVFDVNCEINVFKSGFRDIRLRINFNDIVQSLWNSAKATIEAMLKLIVDVVSGRKRREIETHSVYILHKLLRETREIEDDISDIFINQTIDTVFDTIGFKNSSEGDDYAFRTELFRSKCEQFETVHFFFLNATETLYDLSNETANTLLNATDIQNELGGFTVEDISANVSIESIGLNTEAAQSDFNLTMSDLHGSMESARQNMSTDPYLLDIEMLSNEATSYLENQTEDANKINIVSQWTNIMDNITAVFFDEETCVTFLDCAHYSVTLLYEIFTMSNIPSEEVQTLISQFENTFLNLTGNYSHTIVDVYTLSLEMEQQLAMLQTSNLFCSQPPTILSPLFDKTVIVGYSLSLVCNVTANPAPSFWWFKDDNFLPNQTTMILSIHNVTTTNAGRYYCVAGNLVANLTFEEVNVRVVERNATEETVDETDPDVDTSIVPIDGQSAVPVVAIVVSVVCAVVVILGIAGTIYCLRIRTNAKKRNARACTNDFSNPEYMGHPTHCSDATKPHTRQQLRDRVVHDKSDDKESVYSRNWEQLQ